MPNGSSTLGRPLNLLICSNTVDLTYVAGADRDWVNLLNALGPSCVRVTWAGIRGTASLSKYVDERVVTRFLDLEFLPFFDFFNDAQYRFRSSQTLAGLTRGYLPNLLPVLRRLSRSMREDPPDVVITNTSVVLVGAAFAVRRSLPHIWCVKEFLDPTVRASHNFARLIERLSDAVVVPSTSTARAFSGRVRVLRDGSDLRAVREGVRTDRTQTLRDLGLPTDKLVVAQVGTLMMEKGQQLTAEAFKQLSEILSEPFSLLFMGVGQSEQREQLETILAAAPEQWRSCVRFLQVESDDFSCLSAADLLVHPSVMQDPYPNAVREALILGKPVIGTNVGGVPELVQDGVTGLLIEPNNVQELVNALKSLLADPKRRADMSKEALAFADEKLNVEICKVPFYNLLLEVSRRVTARD